jgi:hypothetical protein
MNHLVLLMVLRLLSSALLLGFLGAILYIIWRDYAIAAGKGSESWRSGRLVVLTSDEERIPEDKVFMLNLVTSIGRAPSNTIMLPDSFVSNEHAFITWRDGKWWLEDLDSSNGTLLNGHLIEDPVVITSGDLIGIGQTILKVELD